MSARDESKYEPMPEVEIEPPDDPIDVDDEEVRKLLGDPAEE